MRVIFFVKKKALDRERASLRNLIFFSLLQKVMKTGFFSSFFSFSSQQKTGMLDVVAGVVAALVASLYSHKTLRKALESLIPLLVGIAVAALARRLALNSSSTMKREASSTSTSTSSAVAAAEARHAVVLARMKKDQEAIMAAVARLEALTSGAEEEDGRGTAEGRRRR